MGADAEDGASGFDASGGTSFATVNCPAAGTLNVTITLDGDLDGVPASIAETYAGCQYGGPALSLTLDGTITISDPTPSVHDTSGHLAYSLTRVVAVNSGHVVNPEQVAMQVEGSVVYGLTAALYGELTVEKGRIAQSNFHDYRMLKLAEMPKVETVIVPTYDFWGGVGEPTICVVAPAVLNAIHAATGKPVRSLPLKNLKLA